MTQMRLGLNPGSPRIAALFAGTCVLCLIGIGAALPEWPTEELVSSAEWANETKPLASAAEPESPVGKLPAPQVDVVATAQHQVQTVVDEWVQQAKLYTTSVSVGWRDAIGSQWPSKRVLAQKADAEDTKAKKKDDEKKTKKVTTTVLRRLLKKVDKESNVSFAKNLRDKVDFDTVRYDSDKKVLYYQLKPGKTGEVTKAEWREMCNQALVLLGDPEVTLQPEMFDGWWDDITPEVDKKGKNGKDDKEKPRYVVCPPIWSYSVCGGGWIYRPAPTTVWWPATTCSSYPVRTVPTWYSYSSPVMSYRTTPIFSYTPTRVISCAPSPLVSWQPAPISSCATSPIMLYQPAPISYQPAPLVSYQPAPIVSYQPAPMVSYQPAPVSYTPAPTETSVPGTHALPPSPSRPAPHPKPPRIAPPPPLSLLGPPALPPASVPQAGIHPLERSPEPLFLRAPAPGSFASSPSGSRCSPQSSDAGSHPQAEHPA